MSSDKYLAKAPSYRTKRVAEVIKQQLAQFFMERHFYIQEMEETLITITHVDVSPDLKNVKAYYTAVDPVLTDEEVHNFMLVIKPQARSFLAQNSTSKSVPNLTFLIDKHEREASRLDRLFQEL